MSCLVKYRITIRRENCIMCGNCWSLDPTHFDYYEPDGKAAVVKGKTTAEKSEGTFDDGMIAIVEQAEEECPAEIIEVKRL